MNEPIDLTSLQFVVMRGCSETKIGTPIAAFALKQLAEEFIKAEPYREKDKVVDLGEIKHP